MKYVASVVLEQFFGKNIYCRKTVVAPRSIKRKS